MTAESVDDIPRAEALVLPTSARLASITANATLYGWRSQNRLLRDAAFRAYEGGSLSAASAWYNIYQWAALFGQPYNEFVRDWVRDVQAAHVNHSRMPQSYPLRKTTLGDSLDLATQSWLLGNVAFSDEFFAAIDRVDFLPRVFEILTELRRREPQRFVSYMHLALAIAVVYDVPPPEYWPHSQVILESLPRQLPPPLEAFRWWTRQDEQGRTYHRLKLLPASELKFVVDATAPFSELEWAQQQVNVPLAGLPAAYTAIRYRTDRVDNEQVVWGAGQYTLPAILAAGGICVDQAYFATQVGKARGVPTLFFSGTGSDGRHAWFGYLNASHIWNMDAGRYASQNFVTGFVVDPQTWAHLSDHELKFISEHFQSSAAFRESRVHAIIAGEYLSVAQPGAAVVAAQKAVTFEPRNREGWTMLLQAQQALAPDVQLYEKTLRAAALAFRAYPDLEAYYINQVAESLRNRGQKSAADAEMRRIGQKYAASRSDLTIQGAKERLARSYSQPIAAQVAVYNSVVDSMGGTAVLGFFDEIVWPFVKRLERSRNLTEAIDAAQRARRIMTVAPGGELDQQFNRLFKDLAAAVP